MDAQESAVGRGRRFRGALPKLALLTVGAFVGLGVAEVLLRFVGPSFPRMAIPDQHTGARLKPGMTGVWTKEGRASFRINSAGFRDLERAEQKPDDVFRIAVLGDSFIEALQVDRGDSVCALLDDLLNSGAPLVDGKRVEVLSFGVSGYGTAQQLLTLRHHARRYQPDLVVLAFFAGNDISDNSPELANYRVKPFFRWDGEQLVLDNSFQQDPDFIKSQQTTTHWKVALINSSRLVQLLLEMRDSRKRAAVAPAAEGPTVDDIAYVEPASPQWTAAWRVTEELIEQVNRETRQLPADFLLVTLSTDIQAHPLETVRDERLQRIGAADFGYFERRLQALADDQQIPLLQLGPVFVAEAARTGEFLHGFENNARGVGHWNHAGHQLAAREMAAAIRALAKQSDSK
ncbi:MAG: SGNH/GDSL hydrolase family protein [Pirellulaceae bacterium]|jgi:lysophospholipase L1-like esterase|nr:SGNH/GDSL hydrolase family protein [Pirellulaceae bacterium]MDP7017649.1 SGNH/GDSL hydrolase family protein [Pirellulaceae bacterium]